MSTPPSLTNEDSIERSAPRAPAYFQNASARTLNAIFVR